MASVFLGDLDDFIAPGQACINPLFTIPDDTAAAAAGKSADGSKNTIAAGGAPMQLVLEDDRGSLDAMQVEEAAKPDLIRATGNQTAKVSLDDCLACSGCVTSAETVLITQQSTGKLLEAIQSGRHTVIVASISPQARASLAERFGMPPAETHARLLTFVRGLGIHHLVDSSLALDFSLLEAGEEFVQRYRSVLEGVTRPPWAAPPPTVPLSSTRRFSVEAGREEAVPIDVEAFGGRGGGAVGVGASAAGSAGGAATARGPGELLVLTSACPGWVCYAEKTAPEALPFMSTVKSSQQIMGVLAKRVFPLAWKLPPPPSTGGGKDSDSISTIPSQEVTARPDESAPSSRQVFHVSIAQCYDKKLEASRKDFRHEDLAGDVEVDLVLTTAEVLELIENGATARAKGNGGNPSVGLSVGDIAPATDPPGDVTDAAGAFFRSHPPGDLAEPLAPGFPAGQAAVRADGLGLLGGVDGEGAAGGNSGGYLEHVFRYAALRLFGVDLAGQPLVYRQGRNLDFRETSLEVDGRVVLRFAYAYGFRNVQSILVKARRGKSPYHLVEVMACPSGCINGGGQIKPKKEGPRDTRQRVERVSEVLRHNRAPRTPQDHPLMRAVYKDLLRGDPGGKGAREHLHTSYHNVPKLELSNPHMSPW